MKVIAETVGSTTLYDMSIRFYYPHNRPCVAQANQFLTEYVARGMIKLLSQNVPDEATDEDFFGYYKEFKGDANATVAAFMSKFGLDELGNKAATPAEKPKVTKPKAK